MDERYARWRGRMNGIAADWSKHCEFHDSHGRAATITLTDSGHASKTLVEIELPEPMTFDELRSHFAPGAFDWSKIEPVLS